MPKRTGRPCSHCTPATRNAGFDAALIAPRARVERVAEAHGVPRTTAYRHLEHLREAAAKSVAPKPKVKRAPVAASDGDDAKAVTLGTIKALRAALQTAERDAPEDVPRIAQAITSATRLLARLSGSLEVSQSMILRSPHWTRLAKVVIGTLEKRGDLQMMIAVGDAVRAYAEGEAQE